VQRRHPEVRLVVAGEGTLASRLALRARRFPPGVVRWLGHRTDVVALHHALDSFVQASDNEGTSNPQLEAIALETPLVATAVGGTEDVVRAELDGVLVPPGDVVWLAAAIERTLVNGEATATRVREARRRVETRFSFAERRRRVETIYEDLVAGRA
jgi:glycosyltransferase involved in cell wall biosynthesis